MNNPAKARYCGRCGVPQAIGADAFAAFAIGRQGLNAQTVTATGDNLPPASGVAAAMDELRPPESAKLAMVGFIKGLGSIALLWGSAVACAVTALHGYQAGTPIGYAAAAIVCLLWLLIPLGSAVWMWRQAGRGYALCGLFALAIALLIYVYRQNCGAYSKRFKKPLANFPAFQVAAVVLALAFVLFAGTEIDLRRSQAASSALTPAARSSLDRGVGTRFLVSHGAAAPRSTPTAKPTKTPKPSRTKTPKHEATKTPTPSS